MHTASFLIWQMSGVVGQMVKVQGELSPSECLK